MNIILNHLCGASPTLVTALERVQSGQDKSASVRVGGVATTIQRDDDENDITIAATLAPRNNVEITFYSVIEEDGNVVEYIDLGSNNYDTIDQILNAGGYLNKDDTFTAPLRDILPFDADAMPKAFKPLLDLQASATGLSSGGGYAQAEVMFADQFVLPLAA